MNEIAMVVLIVLAAMGWLSWAYARSAAAWHAEREAKWRGRYFELIDGVRNELGAEVAAPEGGER